MGRQLCYTSMVNVSREEERITNVMVVMKMGNIVPRAGFETIYLAFRASVLPLHHVGSLTLLLYPHPPVYAVPYLRGQCTLLSTLIPLEL